MYGVYESIISHMVVLSVGLLRRVIISYARNHHALALILLEGPGEGQMNVSCLDPRRLRVVVH